MLLEFSVDTYDPNAHKFQAILNALVLSSRSPHAFCPSAVMRQQSFYGH